MALAGSPETRFRTKQEYVHKALRDAILACELPPGQRLVIDDLARRLSVSAIPIREALQLLQSEGLVVIEPHVGATVAPISRESIDEVFALMEGLERIAVRAAVARIGDADDRLLTDLVAEMDERLAKEEHERWAELNARLHRAISEASGMPLVNEMTDRVLCRWERLRRFFFSGVLVPRLEQAQREHRELLQALLARDADHAEQVVREHNRLALAAYRTYLSRPLDG